MADNEMLITGTSQSDFIMISSLDDPSTDVIRVKLDSGDDQLFFNSGLASAHASGWYGDDVIVGTEFGDWLKGNSGRDTLIGGGGDDTISGGSDNDILNGGAGDDELRGGRDDDQLHGGTGDDSLYGNSGDDFLDGGEGNDFIRGGAGDDTIRANGGVDVAFGDDGRDTFHLDAGDGFVPGVVFIIKDFTAGEDIVDVTDLRAGGGATRWALDSNADGLLDGADVQVTAMPDRLIVDFASQSGGVVMFEDLTSLSISDFLFVL